MYYFWAGCWYGIDIDLYESGSQSHPWVGWRRFPWTHLNSSSSYWRRRLRKISWSPRTILELTHRYGTLCTNPSTINKLGRNQTVQLLPSKNACPMKVNVLIHLHTTPTPILAVQFSPVTSLWYFTYPRINPLSQDHHTSAHISYFSLTASPHGHVIPLHDFVEHPHRSVGYYHPHFWRSPASGAAGFGNAC